MAPGSWRYPIGRLAGQPKDGVDTGPVLLGDTGRIGLNVADSRAVRVMKRPLACALALVRTGAWYVGFHWTGQRVPCESVSMSCPRYISMEPARTVDVCIGDTGGSGRWPEGWVVPRQVEWRVLVDAYVVQQSRSVRRSKRCDSRRGRQPGWLRAGPPRSGPPLYYYLERRCAPCDRLAW